MSSVTEAYLMGIHEGRDWLNRHGDEDASEILSNVTATARMFDYSSDVGQMLRGERDFWKHHLRKKS